MAITGSGTSGDPYIINTFSDLELIGTGSYGLNKVYKLGANIDASPTQDAGYNSGAGWNPIGTSASPFTGAFDGNNKTISGLYINRSGTDNVGLFGYVNNSVVIVKDLTVSGAVTGKNQVGMIIGYMYYGSVSNLHSSGSVNGTQHVGGILGYGGINGSLTSCSSSASVTATSEVGGIVGQAGHDGYRLAVGSCEYTGTVTGTGNYIGGIIGFSRGDSASTVTIYSNTVTSATISASSTSDYVGGIAGYCYYGRCNSNTCSINVSGRDYVGGIIGYHNYGNLCDANNYSASVSGRDYVAGIAGKAGRTSYTCDVTNSVMTGNVTLTGNYGAFVVGWINGAMTNTTISSGTLTAASTSDWIGGIVGYGYYCNITNCSVSQNVTGDTYVGGIAGQIQYTSTFLTCTFSGTVTGNTYVGGIVGHCGASGYSITMKGTNTVTGTVYGKVSYIGGFIGYIYQGTIESLTTANLTLTTESVCDYVGGIAGYLYSSGTVNYCVSDVDIAARDYIGGIIGCANYTSSISKCVYIGSLSGRAYVGGITGQAGIYSGAAYVCTMSQCYTKGSVIATGNYSGGLIGYTMTTTTNCYSFMSVTGVSYVGGAFGYSDRYSISYCYSKGAVTGSGSNIGGLVGATNATTFTSCYWDTQTSGQNSSAGGTGKTTSQMKTQGTYTSWDFTTIWLLINYNDGYPWLRYYTVVLELYPDSIESTTIFGCDPT